MGGGAGVGVGRSSYSFVYLTACGGLMRIRTGFFAAAFLYGKVLTVLSRFPKSPLLFGVVVTILHACLLTSSYADAPVVGNVSATVAYGSSNNTITLALSGGAPNSIAVATQAAHGIASPSGPASIIYTPSSGYAGPDSFSYIATNASGTSSPATVTITVLSPTINYAPSNPPSGRAGAAYSQSVAGAGGGAAPYTYSLSSGSLPPGLSLSNNGLLSGTPTQVGHFNFQIKATDSSTGVGPFSSDPSTLSLDILPPILSLSPATLQSALVNTAYSQSFSATGGNGPYSYTISPEGTLPAGLIFSSAGVLSGTPTVSGSFTFTVSARDQTAGSGAPFSVMQSYTLVITGNLPSAPIIGTASGGDGSAIVAFAPPANNGGSFIESYTVSSSSGGITATGPASPIIVSGLTNGTAYTFTVTAKNQTGIGPASEASNSVTPTGNQTINFQNPGSINFGTTPTLTATTTAGLPVTFSSATTNVCTITSSGSLTTIAPGTCTIDANQAGNGAFHAATEVRQSFQIVVPGGAVFLTTPSPLPSAIGGNPYSVPLMASGGAMPYLFQLISGGNSLPGVALSDSGVLSGVPHSSGTYSLTVRVVDAAMQTADKTYQIVVNAPTMVLSPATLPSGQVGTAYPTTSFATTGGTAPYEYKVTAGTLPTGLTLSTAGTLSGTPSVSGPFNFTVTATDAYGFMGSQSYAGNIALAAPAVSDKTATTPFNTPVSIDLTDSITGTDINTVAVNTAPVHGSVTISGKVVTYVPSPTYFGGTDTFTYTATNAGGTSAVATVTVTVESRPPLVFTPGAGSLPDATAGNQYTVSVVAGNGAAPYSYAITAGTLPEGLSFDVSTGTISGTPIAVSSTSFTVTAIDSLGFAGTASYVLRVSVPPISVPPLNAAVVAGHSATVDLTSGATGGPFTGARLISLSPPSAGTALITLGDTAAVSEAVVAEIIRAGRYKLKFTASPDFSGTAVATFTLSNAYGSSPAGTVTFVVAPRADPSKDPDVIGLVNAQTEASKRFAAAQISNFNDRLEQLHGGGCLQNQWGLTISDNRNGTGDTEEKIGEQKPYSANEPLSTHAGGKREKDLARTNANNADRCSVFGSGSIAVWTGGFVNFGSMDVGSQNFDYTTVGVSAGIDYRFNASFAAGIGFGYGSDESRIGENGTESDASAYNMALYGSYHPTPETFLDVVAGYGQLNFDSRRFATDTSRFAYGSRNGYQYFGSLTAGYEYKNDGLLVSPYGRLTASRSELDAFSEKGADWANLRYGSQSFDTLTGLLGLRLAYQVDTSWGNITPRGRLEYGHDFAGQSSLALSYTDGPGSSYDLETLGTGNDFATVSVGADFNIGEDLAIGAEYGTSVGQNGTQPQQVRLRISQRF